MPRGAKRDLVVTDLLFHNGYFTHVDSFVSHPGAQGMVHLYLAGPDKSAQRERVYKQANGHCQKCGAPLTEEEGEWNHKQGGLSGRCDCLHNAEFVCGRFVGDCHTSQHVQIQNPRMKKAGEEAVHEGGN